MNGYGFMNKWKLKDIEKDNWKKNYCKGYAKWILKVKLNENTSFYDVFKITN